MRNIRCQKFALLEPYLNKNTNEVIEHCKRVAVILGIISQPVLDILLEEYGLPNTNDNKLRMKNYMYLAGRYHDIGMNSVPKEILQQNILFTDTEREIMHRHVEYGMLLIDKVMTTYSVKKKIFLDVVGNHHERYNGSGYMSGISGDALSLTAQLCAVADSYDSMTTYRIYKDTMTLSQANEELIKNKGVLYSPLAIEAFVTMLDKIEELYNMRQGYVSNSNLKDESIKLDY